MSHFICPVCGAQLIAEEKSLLCKNRHRFDTAKSGYTNLLLSQQEKAKHHGDDKRMVRSRQAFLNKGYYAPLLDALCSTIRKYARNGSRILDAGCGECWYTSNIGEYLSQNGILVDLFGVDISKDALAAGAKRSPKIELAVASIFDLPVKEDYCDMLLSFFAPFSGKEFIRVLKREGIMIRVIPLEKHLFSLKKAVYENPYENNPEDTAIDGFALIEQQEIRKSISLSTNEDILNIFTMTPYYYKTSAQDQKKLEGLSELETETEFGLLVYKKT